MISPEEFLHALQKEGLLFFSGVPDSLLKDLCARVSDCVPDRLHVIAANEGNALAAAAGYYLASGKIACVYLQNSGMGNLINPLTSLTDSGVYKIPVLLIIGWRGYPGTTDESQHIRQGKITAAQLDLLGIPYQALDANSNFERIIHHSFSQLRRYSSPVALLVKPGTFKPYRSSSTRQPGIGNLLRETALRELLNLLNATDIVIATTGKTSREIFELRKARKEHPTDFLSIGAMGHSSSLALGMAIAQPQKRVICVDGDGAMLMHMGSLAIIGSAKPANLIHIVLNNASHESVGGQPTVAGKIDLSRISLACGYSTYLHASDIDSLKDAWTRIRQGEGPIFLEINIVSGSRSELGRPEISPEQIKKFFMTHAI